MGIIDQEHALSLLGGNQVIYHKLLEKFISGAQAGKYSVTADDLITDFSTAARTFHAMKGLSENIGALVIKDLVDSLDEAAKVRDKSAVLAQLDQYNTMLELITDEAKAIIH